MHIFNLPDTEERAVYYQVCGLLPMYSNCRNGHPLRLYLGKQIQWCCTIKSCKEKRRVRSGTWFKRTRLSFVTVLRFIYGWAIECTSISWCLRELQITQPTVVDWNAYMRDACIAKLEHRTRKSIGGEGLIVEIDESLFTKRKCTPAGCSHNSGFSVGCVEKPTNAS